ncbi:MAG: class I SAM-dependent methyltransferase [Clostridia bacterium]|nr:class I SAM-dependent methyltransferase [Clostridia bacterium]
MNYTHILHDIEESSYLISMTPLRHILEIGSVYGMNRHTRILDLCCGYGEMLLVWREAFGASGTGVDLCREFIETGRQRLQDRNLDDVTLICEDIFRWQTEELFDFVCLSGEDFGGLQGNIELLSRFCKPGGRLILGTRYATTDNPPRELIDFEGETLSLGQIYRLFRQNGYYVTYMASDTPMEWERYIMWSARRNLEGLRADPYSAEQQAWCEKWYDMYFRVRRQYEGYATFGIEKL